MNKQQVLKGSYKKNVIDVNRELKSAMGNFSDVMQVLQLLAKKGSICKDSPIAKDIILSSEDSASVYDAIKQVCGKSKSGRQTGFLVLQAIEKYNKFIISMAVKSENEKIKNGKKEKSAGVTKLEKAA